MKNSKKTEWTLLLALIGLAGGLYVLGLALYKIEPYWVVGGSMTDTWKFIIVAVILIAVSYYLLARWANRVEERITERLSDKYKRSLERAKQSLNKRRSK